ncbi:MAG: PHP domain-containing protein [Anaerolineae bacterium]|nr:PHP domain-containing protein [Anaerolineae bacterium]
MAGEPFQKERLSLMRVDLHCHTYYSPDALTRLDGLLRWMDRRGIDRVAVTDHNTAEGALDFKARAPDRIIAGEEILTDAGELLALFIHETVPPGLSAEESIARVRAQGGIVGASHPLDRARVDAVGPEVLEALAPQIDFVEVLNARAVRRDDNVAALQAARSLNLPGSAGSDAHAALEVGRAYVEMPAFDGPASFLKALAEGQVHGRESSPLIHLVSIYARLIKSLGAR